MLKILLITLFFQTAYMPNYDIYYGINEKEYDLLELNNAFYAELGIDLLFTDLIFFRASIQNIFHKEKDDLYFYPDCDQYRVAVGIRWKWLEIGYEHFCFHPIFPHTGSGRTWGEEAIINTMILEGYYEKIYLNIELKGGL